MQQKSKLVTFLLCWLLGIFGVHRFYNGKIGTGILWLLTGGLFGIGVVVDMIMILCNNFRDKLGVPLKNDISTTVIILLFVLWFVLGLVLGIFGSVFSFIGGIFAAIF